MYIKLNVCVCPAHAPSLLQRFKEEFWMESECMGVFFKRVFDNPSMCGYFIV